MILYFKFILLFLFGSQPADLQYYHQDPPVIRYCDYCNKLVIGSQMNGWTIDQDAIFPSLLRQKKIRDRLAIQPNLKFPLCSFDMDNLFAYAVYKVPLSRQGLGEDFFLILKRSCTESLEEVSGMDRSISTDSLVLPASLAGSPDPLSNREGVCCLWSFI